jgi:uncharacterized protein YndB with AHSA1/START domain
MNVAKLIDAEITQATLIRATPEAVYDALTTPEGLDSWFTVGSETDPRPGGQIIFRWKDWGPDMFSGESVAPVLEAVRGKRLVFQWRPDTPDYFTTIEIDFETVEEGTIVRLREHGYHDTPSGRAALMECATGWGEALALVKFYVEHGLRY